MCMEDIRVGRVQAIDEQIQTVTDTAKEIIGVNTARASLFIQNIGAQSVTLSRKPGPTAGQAIVLTAGSSLPLMDIQHHGAMVTTSIFAICAAGLSTSLVIVESLLYKD